MRVGRLRSAAARAAARAPGVECRRTATRHGGGERGPSTRRRSGRRQYGDSWDLPGVVHAPWMRQDPAFGFVVAPPQHSGAAAAGARGRPRPTPCYHRRRLFRPAEPCCRVLLEIAVVRADPPPPPASPRPCRDWNGTRFSHPLVCCRARLRRPGRRRAVRPALAQDADTVTLNFVNADIEAVVKAVAEITGRNFVARPAGEGHGQHRVGAAGAEEPRLSDAALGAAAAGLRRGREATAWSRSCPRPTPSSRADRSVAGRSARGGDRLVTQVFTLRNESAAQLVNVLRPLITPNNTIAAYPGEQRARHHRLRRQPAAHRAHHRVDRPGAGAASRCSCR